MVVAQAIVMLIIAVSLGAAGQLCLKHGVNLLGENVGPLGVIRGIFTPYVFMGFVFYLLSSLLYLWVLSKLSLSFAYPFVALSFVMVVFASWWLLGESVPPLRIAGVALIMVGVLTVAASYQRDAPDESAPPTIEQPQ
ncbi:MAG TPA: EamA family transporter [Armatimonadota bacterium]|nr:EamA family transporter [Armatimonadota bacterium]